MAGRVAGKVAFVTGAGRGQGRSHAVRLAEEGADIIAVDICEDVPSVKYSMASKEELAETARLVEALDRRVVAVKADVRDQVALAVGVDAAVAELGRLDIVVANAGICTWQTWDETPMDVWQDTIDINLTGVWKTCKATVPHLIAGGRGGAVIITSSAATAMISANIAHYTASKHGLIGFMRVLAKEVAPHRIRVNTLHPAGVRTPMILNEPMYRLFRPDLENPGREDFEAAARTHNALGIPYVEPEDVSAAVVYLASAAGRYVTGSTFTIDAGGPLA